MSCDERLLTGLICLSWLALVGSLAYLFIRYPLFMGGITVALAGVIGAAWAVGYLVEKALR